MTCPIQPSLNAYIRTIEASDAMEAAIDEQAELILADSEQVINIANELLADEDAMADLIDAVIAVYRNPNDKQRAVDIVDQLALLLSNKIDQAAERRALGGRK